jgi:hypothetical protein
MTPENISKKKKAEEEAKEKFFEKWRNNEPFTQLDKTLARLLGWDLRGWVLEWERGKQMKWTPIGIWDFE